MEYVILKRTYLIIMINRIFNRCNLKKQLLIHQIHSFAKLMIQFYQHLIDDSNINYIKFDK